MTAPRVRHRLIVRHPTEPAILLVDERLPSFVTGDRHTAEVDYVNAGAREHFGLATTVLRSLDHGEPRDGVVDRSHELVARGAVPAGLSWCRRDDAASRVSGDDALAVAQWLAAPQGVVDGQEWTQPRWFDEASAWIRRELGDVREIVQLRAWFSSCVLRVHTADGAFYFKAAPESLRAECGVTTYLARHFPANVAHVVASEPARRWFLMAALPGRCLEEVDDAAVWAAAASDYGRLQAACVTRVGDLRGLGSPTRTIDTIREGIPALAADDAMLRAAAPELGAACRALEELDVPMTLEHGDLWPSNFLVDGAAAAIIDWEDVAIGHPFLSLAPFLAGLSMTQPGLHTPENVARIEHAYLTGFAGGAPAPRLSVALRLAKPLAFVDLALRYRAQRASIVRLHPWMRDLVPDAVRLALSALR